MYKLILLLAGHALCDYPLQGDFLARGKNRFAPLPGTPWYQCLWAHAMIHAGMVLLITQRPWMAIAELVIHAATDYAKCAGWFGASPISPNSLRTRLMGLPEFSGYFAFNLDQGIHVACKILWAVL